MGKWEDLAASTLNADVVGWQRLGYWGPRAKQLADLLRRKTAVGLTYQVAAKKGIIYCKRRANDPLD